MYPWKVPANLIGQKFIKLKSTLSKFDLWICWLKLFAKDMDGPLVWASVQVSKKGLFCGLPYWLFCYDWFEKFILENTWSRPAQFRYEQGVPIQRLWRWRCSGKIFFIEYRQLCLISWYQLLLSMYILLEISVRLWNFKDGGS